MICPDWKYISAIKALKERIIPKDKDVHSLVLIFTKQYENADAAALVMEAYSIFKNDMLTKEILESCLLCEDATLDDITQITGIPETVIDVYRYFFFDSEVFKYRIHRFQYAKTYDNPDFKDGKLYKTWAVSAGIKFFKWHFKCKGTTLVPKEILTDLAGDTFFRAKEHINEPITSSVTKESLKWLRQASESMAYLHKNDAETRDIATEFRLAIASRDQTKAIEDISDAEIVS